MWTYGSLFSEKCWKGSKNLWNWLEREKILLIVSMTYSSILKKRFGDYLVGKWMLLDMASQTRVIIAVAILSVWIHLPYLDAVSATMAKTAAAFVVAPSTDSTPITFATISPGANASCNSTNATRTACFTGDPHFTTFDGYYYDYNGDCPFIFSQPCGNLSCGFSNFSVRAKNRLLYVGAG